MPALWGGLPDYPSVMVSIQSPSQFMKLSYDLFLLYSHLLSVGIINFFYSTLVIAIFSAPRRYLSTWYSKIINMYNHLCSVYVFLLTKPHLWTASSVFKGTLGEQVSDYETGNDYFSFTIMAMNINSLSKGNSKFIISIVWITR